MQDIPRPFWDHLQDLRRALALALGGWLFASIACFNFAGSALAWLMQPPLERLVFTSPAEPFFAYLKLAGFLGFVLAFPWIVYQIWRFIAVALKPDERRVFWELIPVSYALFLGGGALGLFVICPIAMRFLLSFSSATLVPFITLGSYLSFVGWTSLGLGLFFQFPLALFLLASLGLVTAESFSGYRRHVLLGFLAAAALASTGPIDQVMIAVPAYLLFELSLLLIRLRGRTGRATLGAALLLAVVCLTAPGAWAHHSRDWLIAEGAFGGGHLQRVAFSNQDWLDGGQGQAGAKAEGRVEWTPGLLFGIAHQLAIELHGHGEAKKGGMSKMESFGLQPRWWNTIGNGLTLGLSAEYAFALEKDEADHVGGLAALGWKRGELEAVLNLGVEGETEGAEDPATIYRAGVKRALSGGHAAGLEFAGSSGDKDEAEAAAAWYWTGNGLGLKVGLGLGLTEASPDYAIRTSVVYAWGGHGHKD